MLSCSASLSRAAASRLSAPAAKCGARSMGTRAREVLNTEPIPAGHTIDSVMPP